MNTLKLTTMLGLSLLLSACTDALYKVQGESPVSKDRPLSVVNGNALDRSENLERIEEKHFKRLLETTLKKYGYNLHQPNSTQKPCYLFFELKQSTQNKVGSYTTYNTSTTSSNVSGWVGGSYVYGRGTSTTTTPSTNTYTYQVTFQNIHTIFACPDNTGKNQPIWEGAMSAELSDYENNKEDAVANLVGLMELDKFRGKLRIDTDKHIQHIKEQSKRKHYLTIGGDIGIAWGMVNLGEFSPTYTTTAYPYIPFTFRLGYMYDPKKSVAFGINALYSFGHIPSNINFTNVTTTSNRFGLETTMLIKDSFLVGVGLAQDIYSKTTLNANDGGYPQAIKKLNATYGLWRLEYLYNIPATTFYLTTGLSGGWSLSGTNYAGNVLAYNLGLFYKF